MIERTLLLQRHDGAMETFIVHPAEGGPFSPVILYMDMWGIREALRDIARTIAAAGYCCVLPDLYYRGGTVRYAQRDPAGGRLSFADLDADRQLALRAAMLRLSDAMVMEDTAFLFDFMSEGEPVRTAPAGAVGYCMGGRHALCASGVHADRIRATACLHGTDLVRSGNDSPHALARGAEGEIYCGHAELDKYARADTVERLDEALSGRRARYGYAVHAGAQHGYAVPDRDVFNAEAAARDWNGIFAMFRRQLS